MNSVYMTYNQMAYSCVIINDIRIENIAKITVDGKPINNSIFAILNVMFYIDDNEKLPFENLGTIDTCTVKITKEYTKKKTSKVLITNTSSDFHNIEKSEVNYEFYVNGYQLFVQPRNIKKVIFESTNDDIDEFSSIVIQIIQPEITTSVKINGEHTVDVRDWDDDFILLESDIIEINSNDPDSRWIYGKNISVRAPLDVVLRLYYYLIKSELFCHEDYNVCNELGVVSVLYNKICKNFNVSDLYLILTSIKDGINYDDFKIMQSNGRFSTDTRIIYSSNQKDPLDHEFLFGHFIRMFIQFL